MNPVYITGIGTKLGSVKVPIENIIRSIPGKENTSDSAIAGVKRRSGVNQVYRFSESERLIDAALTSSEEAITNALINPLFINGIYSMTTSNADDYIQPSLARRLGERLKMREFSELPVGIGCEGTAALMTAVNQLRVDNEDRFKSNYLVVCGDHISRALNQNDLATSILFSDGASALTLSNQRPENGYRISQIQRISLPGDSFCMTLENRLANPNALGFVMNGESVLEFTVKSAFPIIQELLGLDSLTDDYFVVPHQASLKILKWIPEIFGLSKYRVYDEDISEIGNLGSASYMFALNNALAKGFIKPNQTVVLLSYGADLNIGGAILEPIGYPTKIVTPSWEKVV